VAVAVVAVSVVEVLAVVAVLVAQRNGVGEGSREWRKRLSLLKRRKPFLPLIGCFPLTSECFLLTKIFCGKMWICFWKIYPLKQSVILKSHASIEANGMTFDGSGHRDLMLLNTIKAFRQGLGDQTSVG
jgi:hypothetical protein